MNRAPNREKCEERAGQAPPLRPARHTKSGHSMLLGVNTCVTPCVRTSVTPAPLHLVGWQGWTGARRATGQPCQLRAASPAAAYFLLTD
jgi:hypothetical protein